MKITSFYKDICGFIMNKNLFLQNFLYKDRIEQLLSNVFFLFEKPMTLIICGPTGSGKTYWVHKIMKEALFASHPSPKHFITFMENPSHLLQI